MQFSQQLKALIQRFEKILQTDSIPLEKMFISFVHLNTDRQLFSALKQQLSSKSLEQGLSEQLQQAEHKFENLSQLASLQQFPTQLHIPEIHSPGHSQHLPIQSALQQASQTFGLQIKKMLSNNSPI